MSLYLGSNKLKDLYVGSIKINSVYLGYTKLYSSYEYPYLTFEFSVPDFTPTASLLNSTYHGLCDWEQVSSSPNVWNLKIRSWVYNEQLNQAGLRILFSSSDSGVNSGLLISSNLGGGTCKLIGSGNFDSMINGQICQSLDRMFRYCKGLTSIVPIQCTNVVNVGGMFEECKNIEDGALDQYNWFNTYGVNISNHSGTFTNCGDNTQTGLDELDQIPVGWGGNMVPASTLMTSTRKAYTSSRYTCWLITDTGTGFPGFDKVKNGMYLFTQASVSTYAGVSMNRSRIPNPLNGLGTTQGSYALYFYPAFVQSSKMPGNSGNSVSWIVTTDSPNGNLTTSQGNTDMPGTLDYSTYGPFTREYGTYDSTMDVYFVFLVTNVPIAQWGGLNDGMAFLFNSNFNSDAGLRWLF